MAVILRRIRPARHFPAVRQAVVIAIDAPRQQPQVEFLKVGQAVAIGIPLRIRGIGRIKPVLGFPEVIHTIAIAVMERGHAQACDIEPLGGGVMHHHGAGGIPVGEALHQAGINHKVGDRGYGARVAQEGEAAIRFGAAPELPELEPTPGEGHIPAYHHHIVVGDTHFPLVNRVGPEGDCGRTPEGARLIAARRQDRPVGKVKALHRAGASEGGIGVDGCQGGD